MAIIDPKGLFLGDRLNRCSDLAQLHWPRLYAAANGFARMELNYQKIIASAYSSFKSPPSEASIMGWVREYRDEYLLFIYTANNVPWGQWQTNERYLPGYKTAEDNRSPLPPQAEQEMYRQKYAALKIQRLQQNQRFADLFKNVPSCEELSEVVAIGVGVGVGVGEGKEQKLFALSDEKAIASEPPSVLKFPALQESYSLPVELFDAFVLAYPGIDVMAQLQKARVWLIANPARRKTVRGMAKFLNNWLAREQNSGRRVTSKPNGFLPGNSRYSKPEESE